MQHVAHECCWVYVHLSTTTHTHSTHRFNLGHALDEARPDLTIPNRECTLGCGSPAALSTTLSVAPVHARKSVESDIGPMAENSASESTERENGPLVVRLTRFRAKTRKGVAMALAGNNARVHSECISF